MDRVTVDDRTAALLREARNMVGIKTPTGGRLGRFYPAGVELPPENPKHEPPPPEQPDAPSDPA